MRLGILTVLSLVIAVPQSAFAQVPLTDHQKLGERLFEQSCGVCHTRPTLVSGLYGPALSKEAGGGREDIVRDVISNGTPRMPGFKYTYTTRPDRRHRGLPHRSCRYPPPDPPRPRPQARRADDN